MPRFDYFQPIMKEAIDYLKQQGRSELAVQLDICRRRLGEYAREAEANAKWNGEALPEPNVVNFSDSVKTTVGGQTAFEYNAARQAGYGDGYEQAKRDLASEYAAENNSRRDWQKRAEMRGGALKQAVDELNVKNSDNRALVRALSGANEVAERAIAQRNDTRKKNTELEVNLREARTIIDALRSANIKLVAKNGGDITHHTV